jgi:iron complex outermembrane recepter protein
VKQFGQVSLVTVAVALASAAHAARAADAAPQPAASQAPANTGIAEIIVTATKRSENLQNVPVAVSAISSAALQAKGIFETSDLNNTMPNLQVSSPYGDQQPNFSVRGVGVGTEYNANAASPVGVYVDEVYQAFRATHGQQLYDLQQVEVVRGPQGTLYGRNTTGGAINFNTRAPGLSGENGYATIGYGTYNRVNFDGAAEFTPIEDKLGIRIAGTYVNSDPYLHNVLPAGLNTSVAGGASGLNTNTGISPGGTESWGARATIRFKPSETVDIKLKGYIARMKGGAAVPEPTGQSKTSDTINYTSPTFLMGSLFSELAPTGLVPTSYSRSANGLGINQVQDDTIGTARTQSQGVTLDVRIELADHLKLISLTGYDGGLYQQTQTDCDATPLRMCSIGYNSTFHEFNQDIRLDYSGSRLKSIVGAFYGTDAMDTANTPDFFNFLSDIRAAMGLPASYFNPGGGLNGTALPADALPTGIRATQLYRQVRTSAAIYTESNYAVTPTLKITAGLRFTHDKDEYRDGLTTYYDDAGDARMIAVSSFQQNGAYAPYFLAPVTTAGGTLAIPSYQSLGIPMPSPLSRDGSSSQLTGRAIVDWKPVQGVLVYGSYSHGYRAGTFNGLAYSNANQVYFVKPETVDAFEIGLKSRFLDNRAQFNLSAFHYRYVGQQGQVVDSSATANLVSLNGKIYGLEAELIYKPVESLTLNADLGLIHSAYDKATCPANAASIPKYPSQLGNCVVSPGGPVSVGGNPFPYAAKSSINLGFDWAALKTQNGHLTIHGDADYTGHFYYDAFGNYSAGPLPNVATGLYTQGGGDYWLFNARISYTVGRYTFAAWGKNLSNKVYYPFGISLENLFGNGYRVRADPRTMGIEGTVKF